MKVTQVDEGHKGVWRVSLGEVSEGWQVSGVLGWGKGRQRSAMTDLQRP